ncbi:SDR family oxidoreductase [Nafulsella turpanensis]|uniref:SDR family oxidoreductase n=1 Tax=Nafulsella turpanensis TaxID=1265690 RepID=UPI00034D6937|nr:SDR family oxidoreductase [Nafulsella turpanensis]
MLLITGASGNLGKSTIDFLLKHLQPEQVGAMVRNPDKAGALTSRNVPLRQADYEDYPSLQKVFEGVEKLLFISTSVTGEERTRQHSNVVKAAHEAGIRHIYYTSIVNPSADATFGATPGHFETEKAIKETGITYTFFRNNLYLDLLPDIAGNAVESGSLYFAGGEQRAGFVLREDIAEAIAKVILRKEQESQVYTISAPQTYSFYDVAVALSKAANKPVKYIPISTDYMRKSMKDAQVPAPVIDISTNMADALQKGEFDYPDNTLRSILQREPVDVETFLKQFYNM